MLIKTDLESLSLNSLYELMSFKTEELKAIRNLYGDFKEQQKDVELLQKLIDEKKIKVIQ